MAQSSRVQELISTPEDLERICRELVEDEAAAGSVYIEPSFVPHDFATRFGLTPEELFLRMDAAFQEAGARCGVTVRYMISPNRGRDYGYLLKAADFAVRMRDHGVVSFGWGGDERWGHRRMRAAVTRVRRGGLRVVPHAGEAVGPESVREALELFDLNPPDRIAHGVRAVEDADLLAELARRGITCDVCISSNIWLGVAGSIPDHQLLAMLAAGVMVSLNADDQMFFGSSILNEYTLAREVLHLSDSELADIARCGIMASSAPRTVKLRALAEISAWQAASPGVATIRPPRREAPPDLGREVA